MATPKTPKPARNPNSAWHVTGTIDAPPPPLTAQERATNERIHAEKRKYEQRSKA